MGHSAGGHLVSLLGTSGDIKALEGDEGTPGQSSRVTCVLDFSGPTDFLTIGRDSPNNPVVRGHQSVLAYLLGGPVEEKQDIARAASPVTYVSADDQPFLIVHGTNDPLVPYSQAEELAAALEKAHVSVTLVRVEGGGHGVGGKEVNLRVLAFLDKWLRGRDVIVSREPIVVPQEPAKSKQ
jgi:acetyl esterase/lipase